jgi:hypothetical protein
MKMEDLMKMTVEQLEEIEAELWNEWEMVNSALKVVRYYNKVEGMSDE